MHGRSAASSGDTPSNLRDHICRIIMHFMYKYEALERRYGGLVNFLAIFGAFFGADGRTEMKMFCVCGVFLVEHLNH